VTLTQKWVVAVSLDANAWKHHLSAPLEILSASGTKTID